jgi:hypothetical protein
VVAPGTLSARRTNPANPRVHLPPATDLGQNAPVAVVSVGGGRRTVSEGRRRAEKKKAPNRRPILVALTLAALGSGLAWLFLVRAAIAFGRLARDGQDLAWAFTLAASVGATACLLLMFVLGARVLVALGILSEYKGRRSAGRRSR